MISTALMHFQKPNSVCNSQREPVLCLAGVVLTGALFIINIGAIQYPYQLADFLLLNLRECYIQWYLLHMYDQNSDGLSDPPLELFIYHINESGILFPQQVQ